MRTKDIILKKRQGEALSDKEIAFIIRGYTNGDIPDYQMSALAMAICFCGMNEREVATLTMEMANSGDKVDLSRFGKLSVDKHSTGGVGDKTTLIVAPIVASLGCYVAKMSGRGLGHTGGTVDKLESIPGYKTSLPISDFLGQVEKCGVAVVGQSLDMAPADKKLYSLRDATSTVDSIPLIASSIMSKKLAAGACNIVLDVKAGSGAFMKDIESARSLARCMVDIGKRCGRNVRALITNMDIPLGRAVGNAIEVMEAVSVLKGEVCGDLREVCTALASNMVSLSKEISLEEAEEIVNEAIDSGAAFCKMKEWIECEGGDTRFLEDFSAFPKAPCIHEVKAPKDGYIYSMNCEKIGNCSSLLGAGRMTKDDEIDHSSGIYISAKNGAYVKRGETLAKLYTSKSEAVTSAEREYLSAVEIRDEKPKEEPLIIDTVI